MAPWWWERLRELRKEQNPPWEPVALPLPPVPPPQEEKEPTPPAEELSDPIIIEL